jgi:hypothetical protein
LQRSVAIFKQNKQKKQKKKVNILPPHGRMGLVGAWVLLRLQPLHLPLHNHNSSSRAPALAVRGLWSSGDGVRGGWGWKVVGRRGEVGGGIGGS